MRSALVLLAVSFGWTAHAQTAEPPKVVLRASVDRTAVWIGDRVRYTLEFRCSGDVDVLPEDVAREKLPLTGGEVIDWSTNVEPAPDGFVRRVTYTITSFAVDASNIAIDAFPVRYFLQRAVTSTAQTPPAGQVTVPRQVIALRSTLPEGGRLPELREPSTLRLQPAYLRYVRPIGLLLIAVAIVPVALMLVDAAGWLRRARSGLPRRAAHRQQARTLDELALLEPGSSEERIQALERLDHLVRDHLALATGIPARALTPAEVGGELRAGRGAAPAETVESLLQACERAKYGSDPVGPEVWTSTFAAAESILRGRQP